MKSPLIGQYTRRLECLIAKGCSRAQAKGLIDELFDLHEETGHPLEYLDLSAHTVGVLYNNGVTSVEQLQQMTCQDIRSIDGLKKNRVEEIQAALDKLT